MQDECLSTNKGTTARKGGAANIITEECERLFCDKLQAIFLVERKMATQESLVMDSHILAHTHRQSVREWVEVWDYTTGLSFRGFVGGNGAERTLFVFFGEEVVGQDLKSG